MADADSLVDAQLAFERGDFAAVRAITTKLAASLDPEVRKQALVLRARVGIDPVAVVIVLLSAALFVGVCARYFGGA